MAQNSVLKSFAREILDMSYGEMMDIAGLLSDIFVGVELYDVKIAEALYEWAKLEETECTEEN